MAAPQAVLQPQAWQPPAQAMPATELASSAATWVNRAEAIAPGVPASAQAAPKGGFWMRFFAYLIDCVIMGLPGYALTFAVLHGNWLTLEAIDFVLQVVYFCYYWSSFGKGQTIGMQLLHMKVVKTDGSLLTITGAFIRFIGFLIAAIPLDIGLIWVGFDSQKQGWHDKIAGTYVITNW